MAVGKVVVENIGNLFLRRILRDGVAEVTNRRLKALLIRSDLPKRKKTMCFLLGCPIRFEKSMEQHRRSIVSFLTAIKPDEE